MRDRVLRLIAATALGAAAAVVLLVTVTPTPIARAVNYTRYVAVTGRDDTDCSEITLPCLTPQYAINEASPGDVIKIAAGTYATVTTYAFTTSTTYTFTQIAFISKTLTVAGGYTLTNWTTADVAAHPTIFDAQHAGRGITVFGTGTEAVTVSGLTLTGGDYTGLGNLNLVSRNCRGSNVDCAGGLYATNVRLFGSQLAINGNIASRTTGYSYGGGVALEETLSGTTLDSITVTHNVVDSIGSYGGGLALNVTGALTISNSVIQGNGARGGGGGISAVDPAGDIRVINTVFEGNAGNEGAAMYTETYIPSHITLRQVKAISNSTSAGDVFTIHIYGDLLNTVQMQNVLIAATNVTFTTPTKGLIHSEVGYGPSSQLTFDAAHLTAVANEGVALLEVQAVEVLTKTGTFTGTLTNILVSGLPGLFRPIAAGASRITINADHVLTDSVPAISTGASGSHTIALTQTITGAPLLDGQYRPQAFSAAIDAGRDVGVAVDLSGAPRDYWPDIGAYEAPTGTMTRLTLPSLLK